MIYWNKGRGLYFAGKKSEAAVQFRKAQELYQKRKRMIDTTQLPEDSMEQYLPILEQLLAESGVSLDKVEQPDTARLAEEMDRYYEAEAREQARETAVTILHSGTRNRPLMEKVCSLFIDLGDTELAKEAVAFLMENFRGNGYLLFLQGRTAGLEKDYERGIQLCQQALQDTGLPGWQRELCHNILGRMYRFCGMVDEAVGQYLAASRCEGTSAVMDDYSNYLFNLHYRNENRQLFYEAAQKYESFLRDVIPFSHERPQLGTQRTKLRIGYVSPDFRYHVVAFFCYAMLKHYDRNCFEVYAYAKCEEDNISREFAAAVDHWTNIRRMSAKEAAEPQPGVLPQRPWPRRYLRFAVGLLWLPLCWCRVNDQCQKQRR